MIYKIFVFIFFSTVCVFYGRLIYWAYNFIKDLIENAGGR